MHDNPEEDRKITDQELEYLRTAIGVTTEENMMSPPWKAMLTSKPVGLKTFVIVSGFSIYFCLSQVWAIIIAHFAENWGFYTLLTGLPMFMRDIMGYQLDQVIKSDILIFLKNRENCSAFNFRPDFWQRFHIYSWRESFKLLVF